MKEIDKIAFIKVEDKKILSTRSKGRERYYIPGGKREEGESDQETLIREVKEGMSVDIVPSSIRYFGSFSAQADSHPKGIIVKMTCYTANYEGILKESSEIAEIIWLNYNDIDKVSAVDKKIFEYLRQQGQL
jgi:8-oxo-dGTP diphosphatase